MCTYEQIHTLGGYETPKTMRQLSVLLGNKLVTERVRQNCLFWGNPTILPRWEDLKIERLRQSAQVKIAFRGKQSAEGALLRITLALSGVEAVPLSESGEQIPVLCGVRYIIGEYFPKLVFRPNATNMPFRIYPYLILDRSGTVTLAFLEHDDGITPHDLMILK